MPADQLSATFSALADPTRRGILARLALGEATVSELAEPYDMSMAAVSKHIKILNECGLVVIRKKGRKRYCRADTRKLQEVIECANRYRRFWTDRLDALEALLAEEDKGE
jgi:DNA-binding transcriptional ArsR family regulator